MRLKGTEVRYLLSVVLARSAWLRAAAVLCLLLCAGTAQAGVVWAEVGDGLLRANLTRLADAGVIDLPITDWPIPIADIDRVMRGVDPDRLASPALKAAYDQVESVLAPIGESSLHLGGAGAALGHHGLLRDFDTPARDDGEVFGEIADYGYRWAIEIRPSIAISPHDHQPARLDGSNMELRWGNWLFSFNDMDKWWGPSELTSLILSNNARPMPALEIERATSEPFHVPVLDLIGPWRFIIYVAQAEKDRPDVPNSLFFGNRLSFRPVHFIELAFSRTTQFCGSDRNCDATVWRNVLLGNDTTQYATVNGKPGHAQAGYEFRVNSPFTEVPLAFYYQAIGNDEINRLPARLMRQYGAQGWWDLPNGDRFEGFLEYTDSTCGAGRNPPEYGCAYQNSVFFAGYRYRGLNIADFADADSIIRAAGVRWVVADGQVSEIKVLDGVLNRGNLYMPYNQVSGMGRSTYKAIQGLWRQPAFSGNLDLQLGYEKQQYVTGEKVPRGAFGYISWSKMIQ